MSHMSSQGIRTRCYQDGDENRISRIFERCYSDYSGYGVRKPDFWRWFNILRPGVTERNVFVSLAGDRLVGCLTLMANGEVLDPCYDPEFDGREIIRKLLEVAERTAKDRGLDRLTISIPSDDPYMISACNDLRMRPRKLDRAVRISISDHRALFSLLMKRIRIPDGTFLLDIRHGNGKIERILLDSEKRASMRVEGCAQAEIRVGMNEATLNKVVFKGKISLGDLLLRRVAISPPWKTVKGLRLLGSFHLGFKWFVPRGGVL